MGVAQRHCDGRIVSSLEGGYALSALGRSVAEHVREFLGAYPCRGQGRATRHRGFGRPSTHGRHRSPLEFRDRFPKAWFR
jgi:acetoin utilization deacetylase AcuC-like enzyme